MDLSNQEAGIRKLQLSSMTRLLEQKDTVIQEQIDKVKSLTRGGSGHGHGNVYGHEHETLRMELPDPHEPQGRQGQGYGEGDGQQHRRRPPKHLRKQLSKVRHKLMEASYALGGRDYGRLFQRLDHNHDGELDHDEFKSFLRRVLKVPPIDMPDKDVTTLFAFMDKNGDGSITQEEFMEFANGALTQVYFSPARSPTRFGSLAPYLTPQHFNNLRRGERQPPILFGAFNRRARRYHAWPFGGRRSPSIPPEPRRVPRAPSPPWEWPWPSPSARALSATNTTTSAKATAHAGGGCLP
jgi:hypothetical protein